jgi:hypothetical protein
MKKFELVIEKHTNLGISYGNIDYAISAVNDGTRRELILESLTADYRGMSYPDAFLLLEDIYKACGGEFVKENKKGYVISILLLLFGVACFLWVLVFYLKDEDLPTAFIYYGILSTLLGFLFLAKTLDGKFRENF